MLLLAPGADLHGHHLHVEVGLVAGHLGVEAGRGLVALRAGQYVLKAFQAGRHLQRERGRRRALSGSMTGSIDRFLIYWGGNGVTVCDRRCHRLWTGGVTLCDRRCHPLGESFL